MQYEDMLNFPKKMELSGEGGGGGPRQEGECDI